MDRTTELVAALRDLVILALLVWMGVADEVAAAVALGAILVAGGVWDLRRDLRERGRVTVERRKRTEGRA